MPISIKDDPRYGPMARNLAELEAQHAALHSKAADCQADLDRIRARKLPRGADLVLNADGTRSEVESLDAAIKAQAEIRQKLATVDSAIRQQKEAMHLELGPASSRRCRTVLQEYKAIVDRIYAAADALAQAIADEGGLIGQLEAAGVQPVFPLIRPGIDPAIFGGRDAHNSQLRLLISRSADAKRCMEASLPASVSEIPAPVEHEDPPAEPPASKRRRTAAAAG
jgi:hypothetical protein